MEYTVILIKGVFIIFIVKRVLVYILALSLIFCLFVGCADNSITPPGDTDTIDTTEPGAAAGINPDGDLVILKIDGEVVYSEEFRYWVNYYISAVKSTYGEIEDWSAEISGGVAYAQYVMEEAASTIITYRAISIWADELGVTLSEDDLATIQAAKDYDIEYYGDEATMKEYMESSYMTESLYDYICEVNQIYSAIYLAVNGETGEKRTDMEVQDYAAEYGLMQAKQIMKMNVDSEGEALPDSEIEANYAELEAILAELDASDDSVALFDSLIEAHSEDSDAVLFKSGYLFAEGELIPAFEETCKVLDEGEYSGIVESEQGFHIILRLPINPETIPARYYINGYERTLRQIAAEDLFATELAERANNLNVVYTINYDTFNLAAYL